MNILPTILKATSRRKAAVRAICALAVIGMALATWDVWQLLGLSSLLWIFWVDHDRLKKRLDRRQKGVATRREAAKKSSATGRN